jgi:DNA-binding response OmpR family regulator
MPTTTHRRTTLRRVHRGSRPPQHRKRAGNPVLVPGVAAGTAVGDATPGDTARPVTTILVVENEPGGVSSLESGLRASGATTIAARTSAETLSLIRDHNLDLLILDVDVDVSDIDGRQMLRAIRASGVAVPVIVLARPERADPAPMLESGADDFMAKPIRFEELLARIRARLRPSIPPARNEVTVGPLSLDRLARRCTVDNRVIELTTREFGVAEALVGHPRRVLTRRQLADQAWGPDLNSSCNVIDVYIRHLRRKLGDDIIHTVRGIGYRLNA